MRPGTCSIGAVSSCLPSAHTVGRKESVGKTNAIIPLTWRMLRLGLLLTDQSFAFIQKEQHFHKRNQVKAGLFCVRNANYTSQFHLL